MSETPGAATPGPATPTGPGSARPAPAGLVTPMRAVVRRGGLALVVALPVAAAAGFLLDGSAGMLGAVLGVLIPAAFFGATVGVALLTARTAPSTMGALVLVSWLVKMVLLVGVMALLAQWDSWSRSVFLGFFLVGVAGWLVGEAYVVVRSRVTYVD